MKRTNPGRIKATPERLVQKNSRSFPDWYEDSTSTCVDCRERFVFTALEQQMWYEEFGIPHYAHPKRCLDCSKSFRKRLDREKKYGDVRKALMADPKNAELNFECGK